MKKIIIASILVVSMLCGCISPIFAADEQFLSEVALVYRDSVEEAKKAIEGTDWKLFEKDLNPNADYMFDDGVYLIYKTSTNVEDAITDLRVMDMYGGFSTSNYERQLEESRQKYLETVTQVRVIAAEFKALYEAGDPMAAIAYRQMNYYKDMGESEMMMGDFLLNIPSDEALVRVMMEGNSAIFTNLISLLAVGISGSSDSSLADRISNMYAIKDTLTNEKYYDKAVVLSECFENIRSKILRYDTLSEEYDLDDEEMSEEEFVFMSQYMSLVTMLEQIMLGQTKLVDVIRAGEWEIVDLYPIAAALTDGQIALVSLGNFETVLKYSTPSKPIEELTQMLEDIEAEMKDESGNIQIVDVYTGVDRSIFKGSFAMTNAAERQQALTGDTWGLDDANESSKGFYIASISLAALDTVVAGFVIGISVRQAVLRAAIRAADGNLMDLIHANNANNAFAGTWGSATTGLTVAAIGIALIAAGLSGISTWYNYYNPDYTEIPNVMIDVRETELGDKYVKFTAAKVFGEEDMNADFNAYEGKEWNALYYTKDATAGNCLTPNFVYRENNATVSRRHQGVSMFGETDAFDLNSHVYNDDAVGVYLSVRYSMTKKEAADMPSVVGSMMSNGAYYMLTAMGGIGIGMASTAIFLKRKKVKE